MNQLQCLVEESSTQSDSCGCEEATVENFFSTLGENCRVSLKGRQAAPFAEISSQENKNQENARKETRNNKP